MTNPDHLYLLRRQILKLAVGPISRDELYAQLPAVKDEQDIQEAREAVELLIGLGYLVEEPLQNTYLVQSTEKAIRAINRLAIPADPAIWGRVGLKLKER